MHLRTRRLTSAVAALGLAAGVLTVTATAASAVNPPPTAVDGYGYYKGYAVEWEAPTDAVDPLLDGYAVSLRLASDSTVEVAQRYVDKDGPDDDGDLYAEFDNLTPGTRYFARIIADYSAEGDSVAVNSPVDYAYTYIGAVRGLKAKAGKKSIWTSWGAPVTSPATGAIDSYGVFLNGQIAALLPAGQRSIKLTGLTNGRRYTIHVAAVAAAGPGPFVSKAATPIGSPAKPTKFKRSWKKGGKAKLTWKKAKSTAAAPVAGYYVYVNGKRKAKLGKGTTSYTVKGLKKGKKYSFSIRSRNAVGTSSSVKIAAKKRP